MERGFIARQVKVIKREKHRTYDSFNHIDVVRHETLSIQIDFISTGKTNKIPDYIIERAALDALDFITEYGDTVKDQILNEINNLVEKYINV